MPNNKKQELKTLLRIHYGYDSFRRGQEQAIDAVLDGQDTVVIMPTGGGKSLIYQLPSLVLDGLTIVVSPLISLMKDQVDALEQIGIPATFINSSISAQVAEQRMQEAKNGYYKLLYIAPERFYSSEFMRILSEIRVSLFAIDEAHCISAWGHDFRPAYLKIKNAIDHLGRPPVLALTATATPEVRKDIIKQLNLKNPQIVLTGFARENLSFQVRLAGEAQKAEIVLDAVKSANGSGIVYVGTRSKADALGEFLKENNIDAIVYHAGMDAEQRKITQELFLRNKVKVIIATNAFGMGIDKPDIRFVIHYDMPGTIEAYYQEVGRAGRDGKESFCLLLHNSRDRFLREFFIKGDNPPIDLILNLYELLNSFENDSVLITYAELKARLGADVPEMAIGTAIKILEQHNYISRIKEKSGEAYLCFLEPVEVIKEKVGTRAKKTLSIIDKLYQKFSRELELGFEFNFEELAENLEEKKDSLKRAVKKIFDLGLVDYKPPFKGTEIRILKRVPKNNLNLDFEKLKEKRESAYQKLDAMEDYIYNFSCRQKFILNYFEDPGAKSCGKCDNCLNESQSEEYVEEDFRKREYLTF